MAAKRPLSNDPLYPPKKRALFEHKLLHSIENFALNNKVTVKTEDVNAADVKNLNHHSKKENNGFQAMVKVTESDCYGNAEEYFKSVPNLHFRPRSDSTQSTVSLTSEHSSDTVTPSTVCQSGEHSPIEKQPIFDHRTPERFPITSYTSYNSQISKPLFPSSESESSDISMQEEKSPEKAKEQLLLLNESHDLPKDLSKPHRGTNEANDNHYVKLPGVETFKHKAPINASGFGLGLRMQFLTHTVQPSSMPGKTAGGTFISSSEPLSYANAEPVLVKSHDISEHVQQSITSHIELKRNSTVHKDQIALAHNKKKEEMELNKEEENSALSGNVKGIAYKEKVITCWVCTEEFSGTDRLIAHVKAVHKGHNPYKCTHCSREFSQYNNLRRHLRVHREKLFKCQLCDREFNEEFYLKMHMATHTGKRVYSCGVCSAGFPSSHELKIHVKSHSPSQLHTCSVCDKSFSKACVLRQHMKGHSGERPHKCEFCPKTFIHRHHLTMHMRSHTDNRQYCCTVCSKTFSQSSHLYKHLRSHDSEKPEQGVFPSMASIGHLSQTLTLVEDRAQTLNSNSVNLELKKSRHGRKNSAENSRNKSTSLNNSRERHTKEQSVTLGQHAALHQAEDLSQKQTRYLEQSGGWIVRPPMNKGQATPYQQNGKPNIPSLDCPKMENMHTHPLVTSVPGSVPDMPNSENKSHRMQATQQREDIQPIPKPMSHGQNAMSQSFRLPPLNTPSHNPHYPASYAQEQRESTLQYSLTGKTMPYCTPMLQQIAPYPFLSSQLNSGAAMASYEQFYKAYSSQMSAYYNHVMMVNYMNQEMNSPKGGQKQNVQHQNGHFLEKKVEDNNGRIDSKSLVSAKNEKVAVKSVPKKVLPDEDVMEFRRTSEETSTRNEIAQQLLKMSAGMENSSVSKNKHDVILSKNRNSGSVGNLGTEEAVSKYRTSKHLVKMFNSLPKAEMNRQTDVVQNVSELNGEVNVVQTYVREETDVEIDRIDAEKEFVENEDITSDKGLAIYKHESYDSEETDRTVEKSEVDSEEKVFYYDDNLSGRVVQIDMKHVEDGEVHHVSEQEIIDVDVNVDADRIEIGSGGCKKSECMETQERKSMENKLNVGFDKDNEVRKEERQFGDCVNEEKNREKSRQGVENIERNERKGETSGDNRVVFMEKDGNMLNENALDMSLTGVMGVVSENGLKSQMSKNLLSKSYDVSLPPQDICRQSRSPRKRKRRSTENKENSPQKVVKSQKIKSSPMKCLSNHAFLRSPVKLFHV